MKYLNCYSYYEFNEACRECGYTDTNLPEDIAFISIINTEDCQKFYMKEEFHHYFQEDHENVLNLEFDDISEDEVTWEGHIFYGLQINQAQLIYEFIKKNLGKNFWIHCHAGYSRSQGVVRYILDCYPEFSWITREDNPPLTPNVDVLTKLKRIYWERENIYLC